MSELSDMTTPATSPAGTTLDNDDDGDTVSDSDETAAIGNVLGEPIVQIALLLVVLLLLMAFIRTRKHELDYSMHAEDDLFDED